MSLPSRRRSDKQDLRYFQHPSTRLETFLAMAVAMTVAVLITVVTVSLVQGRGQAERDHDFDTLCTQLQFLAAVDAAKSNLISHRDEQVGRRLENVANPAFRGLSRQFLLSADVQRAVERTKRQFVEAANCRDLAPGPLPTVGRLIEELTDGDPRTPDLP